MIAPLPRIFAALLSETSTLTLLFDQKLLATKTVTMIGTRSNASSKVSDATPNWGFLVRIMIGRRRNGRVKMDIAKITETFLKYSPSSPLLKSNREIMAEATRGFQSSKLNLPANQLGKVSTPKLRST